MVEHFHHIQHSGNSVDIPVLPDHSTPEEMESIKWLENEEQKLALHNPILCLGSFKWLYHQHFVFLFPETNWVELPAPILNTHPHRQDTHTHTNSHTLFTFNLALNLSSASSWTSSNTDALQDSVLSLLVPPVLLSLGSFFSSSGTESDWNAGAPGDASSTPGLGRSPGGRNGSPFQYSCLENSMGRGAWWTIVHGAVKSQTWLNDWTTISKMIVWLSIKSKNKKNKPVTSTGSCFLCHVYVKHHNKLFRALVAVHRFFRNLHTPSILVCHF